MWTFGPLCSSPNCALINESVPANEFTQFINSQDQSTTLIEITATKRVQDYVGNNSPHPIASYPMCDMPGASQVRETKTFFFSNTKWIGRPTDEYKGNRKAIPRVIQSADVERTLPLSPETNRRGDVSIGSIQLVNNDGGLDDFISNWSIADQIIRIYYGRKNSLFKSFKLIGEFFGDGFENTLDKVTVKVKSTAAYLDKPFYYSRYAGTGGLEGDFGLSGTIRPTLYGDCFNVTPVLINKENWVYQVHDGKILAVDHVREIGLDFVNDGDVSDYVALVGATVVSGHYLTCKNLGLFRAGFSGEPAGSVCADVRGDVDASGYTERTGEILSKIVTQRGGLGSEYLLGQTFRALPSGGIGYYTQQNEKTVADVFNDLLGGINGWYGSERSKLLKVGYFEEPNGKAYATTLSKNVTYDIEEIGIEQPPRYQQKVKFRKNWTVLNESDISPTLESQDSPSATRQELLTDGGSKSLSSFIVKSRQRDAIIGSDIQTYFKNEDDANQVLERVMSLYQETRRRFRVKLPRIGYLINLQDYIRINNPRLGLLNGKTCLVLGLRDDGKEDKVEITLWG